MGGACYGARVLVEVAVCAPVRGTFTYEAEAEEALVPGRRLLVPFGRRRAIAFSLGPAASAPAGAVKRVEKPLDDGLLLTADVLELVRFAADYYLYPLGAALAVAVPPVLGREKSAKRPQAPLAATVRVAVAPEVGAAAQAALFSHLVARGGAALLEELRRAVKDAAALVKKLEAKKLVAVEHAAAEAQPDPFASGAAPPPTDDQLRAGAALESALGTFRPFLLQGVTGSGKTEVYLRLIAAARARGKGALVLVPEIALTPQLAGRFRSRFGDDVAVLHSGLSDRERAAEHRRLLEGAARIAVGVRSAVFAPVRDLGVLVVDEEHEPSFKQEESLRYHARDLAVYRARLCGAPVVLGSATPSLETLKNAAEGRYEHLRLPKRVDARPLPVVELVDLARGKPAPGAPRPPRPKDGPELLSPALFAALEEVLQKRQQAILFLNRRGHASLVVCAACGEGARCPSCDVSLTHHLARRQLRCHYCDHQEPMPEACPACGGEILQLGVGTERVEQELARRLPEARVLRLDRDAVSSTTELTRVLAAFARREADVLVGTQMVAKGHDFPGVTLVGVVLADVGLAVPDFRAGERTFQLLTQVAGRAGRGTEPGRVLVQTFHAGQDAIASVLAHDFDGFAARELERRRPTGFSPFARLVAARLDGVDGAATERLARRLGEAAVRLAPPGVRVLGPAPASIPRLRGRVRWQLLLSGDTASAARSLARRLQELADPIAGSVRVAFDVDPISML